MTREEQITQFAESETALCKRISNDYGSTLEEGIIIGAKWADENPKEGLVSIDKVIAFLKENIDLYAKVVINKSRYPEIVMCDSFERVFRKAMDE